MKLSDLIDNTYHAQIEMTLEEAKGTQKILESKSGEGTETQPSGTKQIKMVREQDRIRVILREHQKIQVQV